MGSLVDLNLSPDSTATAATTTTTSDNPPVRNPKIEPKEEPLEFSTPPPHQPQPQLPPQQPHPQQTPITTVISDPNPIFLQKEEHTPSSDKDILIFSEFSRVSEMFRAAFARRMLEGEALNHHQQQQQQLFPTPDTDSRAIVSIPEEDNNVVAVPLPRLKKRSSELVRVSDMSPNEQQHFRDVYRRTRRLYDSLRVITNFEDAKRNNLELAMGLGKRNRGGGNRGDSKAAQLMGQNDLWLNRDKRIVGSIPGVEIGDLFFFRFELCVVGLHGLPQAGIDYLPAGQSSNGEPIATSIVVSGGYEDDEDKGYEIIYTGQGGQDKHSRQCEHQKLEGGNLALERSMHYGIEIRVIRGYKYEGGVSSKVYVYDGLYRITDCWFDMGKSGFGVYKYKLVRMEGQGEMGTSILRFAESLRARPLSVRPRGYLSFDISRKRENIPIRLFNDIDDDNLPLRFQYLPTTVFPPFVFDQGSTGRGCDCLQGCGDGCFCAMLNGGEFGYDHKGVLLRGKPVIFECGAFCRCPPHCQNRVSQKGLRNQLEVFRSRETGWGVRSLDLIHAGAFICEYAGVVLTREQAEIFAMTGDNLIYPNRFPERWAEWGDLSQVNPDYIRPSQPSIPPLNFAMDVSRMRNVACYMSHSPTPNVMVQFVMFDHNNLMFPHLMLFAMENIPPLRELSLDYGLADEPSQSQPTEMLAICN
ncbi:hypothetical protein ACFE04_008830 [Oxalis oulophora]